VRIVYNSFHGRFSDNPRAIYERLRGARELEHVWLADTRYLDVFPVGTVTVDIDSPEAAAVLESADLVVANSHTEVDWVKPAGTFYLQTWHGTPWKRIHHDVLWAPPGRLARLDRDIARWDLLLSPNRASTPRLRRAFRYDGPVAETGYPRNDVLTSGDSTLRRRRVRRELGLDADTTAVLYAPTWRDHEFFEGGPSIPMALDANLLAESLGEDHVVLVRAHNMVTSRLAPAHGPQVRDVSLYPDISELYLAADVLVTDYSSAMFDFAITGKPMVFFAYDLEDYRSSTRGFYFDLQDTAPGPVVQTFEELVQALQHPSSSLIRRRYADFWETFCHLEDGRSSDRVLHRLGLLSELQPS
jgi:CDP-glycerol glycerophosphotransferase